LLLEVLGIEKLLVLLGFGVRYQDGAFLETETFLGKIGAGAADNDPGMVESPANVARTDKTLVVIVGVKMGK